MAQLELIPAAEAVDEANGYNSLPHSLYSTEEFEGLIYGCEMVDWEPKLRSFMKEPILCYHRFKESELKTLASAARSRCLTGRVPAMLEDDLEDIEKSLAKWYPPHNVFVRFNAASPKDANIPKDGFSTGRQIVDAIISSQRVYKNCLVDRRMVHNQDLFYSRFDPNWDIFKEWRVFVFLGHVRAISQYDWTRALPVKDTAFVPEMIEKMLAFADDIVRASEMTTFVMDVYREDDGALRLIELNNYVCAGACLFRWKEDAAIIPRIGLIANSPEVVVVRIAV